jgi:hypothetical protein
MPPSEPGPAPQESPLHKAAKLAVIILSILIILGVIALVVGVVLKTGKKPAPARMDAASTSELQLPPGAVIREMAAQPGRLILRLQTSGGEEVLIVDTQDGHLVSRIRPAK